MIKLAYNKENPNLVFEVEDIVRKSINGHGIVEYYRGTLVDTSTIPDTRTLNYDVQVMGFESNWAETPVDLGSTGNINNQNKTASPTTEEQTIVPDAGYTGLNQVDIDAVNIDTAQTVTPTTEEQNINPSAGSLGIASVKVNAVTADIDSNIAAENIKQGVSILGVNGTLAPGLEIQNGRKVNYKATSGTVPKGMFIKLNTNYTSENINTILGVGTTSNYDVRCLTHVFDNVYAFIGNGKLNTVEITDAGITKYLNPWTPTVDITDGSNSVCLTKIADGKLMIAGMYSNGRCIQVINIANGVISGETPIQIYGYDSYGRNWNIKDMYVTEDNDYYYLYHLVVTNNPASGGTSSAINSKRISKSDGTITNGSDLTINSSALGYLNTDNQGHLIGFSTDKICYTSFGSSTTFTSKSSTWSNLGYSSFLTQFYAYVNNKHVFIVNDNNVLKAVTVTFEPNITINSIVELGAADIIGCVYNRQTAYTIDDKVILIGKSNTTATDLVYKVIENTNNNFRTTAAHTLYTGVSNSTSNYDLITNNSVLYTGTKIFIMCTYHAGFYTLDSDTLLLDQETGTPVTVSAATTKIEGVTNAECTTTTAGEVILLNS